MSSIGLGKPPVIYPTPLDISNDNRGNSNSSAFMASPPMNRTISSPLISKYSKRRIKKLGNKSGFPQRGLAGATVSGSGSHKKHVGLKGAKRGQKNNRRNGLHDGPEDGNTNDEYDYDDDGNDNTESGAKNSIYIKESEEYKLHLIRKIFLPKVSLDSNIKDYLPAMTSSSKVDIELYCFIGLLFKNFINEWYFKITENDEFISEVIDVAAHIIRNLETRVRKINVNDLLLDYIPFILDNHRLFYAYCLNNLDSQYIQFTNMNEAFDAVNNHPALSLRFKQKPPKFDSNSSQEELNYNFTLNESLYNDNISESQNMAEDLNRLEENYLSMLSKGALALLLPLDVSDSNLAKYFVRSVMSNIVLKILTKQLSEPDIIYTIFINIFKKLEKDKKPEDEQEHKDRPKQNKTHNKLKHQNHSDDRDEEEEVEPKTIKGKVVSIFRTVSHFIAYSTSAGSSSQNSKKLLANPPVVDRYVFRFINNLFNFSVENPILYIFVKYFSLWFLTYNINEIRSVKKMSGSVKKTRSKSISSANSSGSGDSNQQSSQPLTSSNFIQTSLSTIVNSNLFSIKLNKIVYNLFEKLVVQKFFQNELFISSLIKLARNMIFPNDDKMGPPRKVPNEQELEEMKIELFLLMKKNIPYWFKLLIFNEVGNGTGAEEFHTNNNHETFFDDSDQDQHTNIFPGHNVDASVRGNKFRSLIKTKTDFKFYQFIESFKYQKFNKLLIYNLIDHLFMELFPELKDLTPSVLEKHE